MNPIPLVNENLAAIGRTVEIPTYDRDRLSPGIVHIGLGNFHRAHQAWYLHRLFQQGRDHDWAIIGAGVQPYDAEMRRKLAAQDYLTTLIELDPRGNSAEVIGSMLGYVVVEDGCAHLVEQMAEPAIRIVTLTATEGGYFVDPADGSFDSNHADIQYDARHAGYPRTAFGAIVAALKLRRDRGIGPFTGLSCDNLQGSGKTLRQAVVSLAALSDPALAEWIDRHAAFPDSMVDCIVPTTGTRELDLVREFGIDDAVPVTHENFRQWVIEDEFCAGRPAWEEAGVIFSDRVPDFERMKIRILNGGHQVIAYMSELLGIETVAEAVTHQQVLAMYRKVLRNEVAPHVGWVPGYTAEEYVDLVERRFSNSAMADTTRRIAFDGSNRHPGFVRPSIADALRTGASVEGLALVSATWARYCAGFREDGSLIEPNDPHWNELVRKAKAARERPGAWLDMPRIYGDLGREPRFADAFERWLKRIYSAGLKATVDDYLHCIAPE